MRTRRWRHAVREYVGRGDRLPVITGVGRGARDDHCAFDGHTSEQTSAAAVGVYCRGRRDSRLQISSDWTRGDAHIRSEGDVTAARKSPNGCPVIQHKDEIRDLTADLQTPARTAGSDERRTGPAIVVGTSDDDTVTGLAGENETGLHYGHDCKTARVSQHRAGNPLLWDRAKLAQNPRIAVDDLLFTRRKGALQ